MARHKSLKVRLIRSAYLHKGHLHLIESRDTLDDWKFWRFSNEYRIPAVLYKLLKPLAKEGIHYGDQD